MASIFRSSPSVFVCPLTEALSVTPHAVRLRGREFHLGKEREKSHGTKGGTDPQKANQKLRRGGIIGS